MPSAPRKAGRFQSGTTLAGALSARTRSITPETSWGGGSHSPSWTRAPPAPPAPGRRPGRQGIVPGGRPAPAALPGTGGRQDAGRSGPAHVHSPDMPGHSFLCRSISIDAGESKSSHPPAKFFAGERRARAIRDFTVPRSRSRTWAISLVGESGQLPHDQHLAVVIREGRPAPAPGPGGALSAPPPPGAGAAGPPPGRDRFPSSSRGEGGPHGLGPPLLSPQMVQAQVGGQAVEPGGKAALPLKGGEGFPRLEKRHPGPDPEHPHGCPSSAAQGV